MDHSANLLRIVAVPNETGGQLGRLKRCLEDVGVRMFQLHLPMNLKVGTLDELMLISDELTKLDAEAEAVARKMQRKYREISGPDAQPLGVGGISPRKYWETFQWNVAAYPYNRKLPQIAKIIQNHIKTANTNFTHGISVFQDAKNKLAAAQRRAGGNLLVSDLNDVLAEIGRDPREMFKEMEFLKRVVVVVQTNEAKKFVETYHEINASAITVFRESAAAYSSPCAVPTVAPVLSYTVLTESDRALAVDLGVGAGRSPTVWQIKSALAAQHNFDYAFIQLWAHNRVLGDQETLESAGVDALTSSFVPPKPKTEEEEDGVSKKKKETDEDDDEDDGQLRVIFESPSQNVNRVAEGHLSPAVPGSHEFLTKDKDGYSMYTLQVVRGRDDQLLQAFKSSCQKLRYTVREYRAPSPKKLAASATAGAATETKSMKKILRELEDKQRDAKLDLLKRCPAYFDAVYTALAHIKAIRVFAESVLRFGVPPNFVSVVVDYEGRQKMLARAEMALGKLYSGLDILGIASTNVTDKASQAEQNLLDKSQQKFYPYVYVPVDCMDDRDSF